MICFVPISDEDGVISGGFWEGDGNERPAENSDSSEAAGSLVESKRGEIEEAANLIFDLESVSVVLAWWNGTCGSINPILV